MNLSKIHQRWLTVAALGLAVVVAHAWFSSFNHDEVEHLHATWLIAAGERPFADFCEQHHPTFWLLFAPLAARVSSGHLLAFVVRLFDLGCWLGLLAVLYRLIRRLYPELSAESACWPVALTAASFMFMRNMMAIRPDPLMNLLVYLGLPAWCAFVETLRWRHAIKAGLAFGLAVVLLQKALIVTALVGGGLVVLLIVHRRNGARLWRLVTGGLLLAMTAAAPVLLLYAGMRRWGIWSDFWFWNYDFNSYFYLKAPIALHFSMWSTLAQSALENCILWLSGLAGVGLAVAVLVERRRQWPAGSDAKLALVILLAGYFGFLLRNGFPFQQYFIVVLPLLGLFSSEVFARAHGRQLLALRLATAAMGIVLVISVAAYSPIAPQLAFQKAVLARTTPAQTVFIPPQMNPIYRRDAAYFWYNGALLGETYASYCREHADCPGNKLELNERLWREQPPAFVYLHPQYRSYDPYGWDKYAADYVATDEPGLLRRR